MKRSLDENLLGETVSHKIIYYDDVYNDLDTIFHNVDRKLRRHKKIYYYDIPVTFDIETTSFYEGNEKRSCMYIWMFSIDDNIIIGRTWKEFSELCKQLEHTFSLHPKFRRIIIYVQNLGFEFQFICNRFKWEHVFALKQRVPLTALTSTGIEFRCSYKLSDCSLAKMGEDLQKYKVRKMVGDLDYSLKRHSKTPLDDKELLYCINDVRVLSAYIREKIENEGGITKIPLTKTGYVRKYCKQHIYEDHKSAAYKAYRKLMKKLTIEPDEFVLLRQAFQGGFTHANPYYADKTMLNVESQDFNSSYPAQMVAQMYPMSKGELYEIKDKDDFRYQLDHYCCIFVIKIYKISSKILFDNYLSYSKCRNVISPVLNNGRIYSAEYLETTITNLDYEIIKECYECEDYEISTFYRYSRDYLPTSFIDCVLSFYEAKTKLKNVKGKEIEYQQGKSNLNSCYGMCCSGISKPVIEFTNEWVETPPDLESDIEKHNNAIMRFLFYPWGVFITAWARYALWKYGILKVGYDYVYSDTDSIKYINPEKHQDFILEYNKMIGEKMIKAMRHHKMDPERVAPKTIDGLSKPLGIWDFDGSYKRFKTLGAKRYVGEYEDGSLLVTVAGLSKKAGRKFLESFNDPFDAFTNNMAVPKGKAGRQTATYIDYETSGSFYDYLGNAGDYHEMTSLHLEETGYDLSLASSYIDFILGIGEIET